MSYKIIGKYIKELKFNIPNPKTFFLLSKNITNYKINKIKSYAPHWDHLVLDIQIGKK